MDGLLSPRARLEAQERGAGLHPVDQALMLLCSADRGAPGPLAHLPLAERDRRLLESRRATYGDGMACLADCPDCGATQEFELSAAELIAGLDDPPADEVIELEGWQMRLRPLQSADLAAAAGQATPGQAAAALAARAVAEVLDPRGAPAGAPPERLWPVIERRVAEREAAAEIALDLTCPDCGAARTFGLDVGAYFWLEVDADARRLLGEVAALAARFGWSEESVLAMPAARRRAYLELAEGA